MIRRIGTYFHNIFRYFRFKSVLVKILLLQMLLVGGIFLLSYGLISNAYGRQARERAVNDNLSLLNLAGNQIDYYFRELLFQMEDILVSDEVSEVIVSNDSLGDEVVISLAGRIAQVGENNAAMRAMLLLKASGTLIFSNKTVRKIDSVPKVSQMWTWCEERIDTILAHDGFFVYEDDIYLLQTTPKERMLAAMIVMIDKKELEEVISEFFPKKDSGSGAYLFAGEKQLTDYPLPEQRQQLTAEDFMVVSRERTERGDDICELSDGRGLMVSHPLNGDGHIRLISFFNEGSSIFKNIHFGDSVIYLAAMVVLANLLGIAVIYIAYRPVIHLMGYMLDKRSVLRLGAGQDRILTQKPGDVKDEFDLIKSLYQEHVNYEEELADTMASASGVIAEKLLFDVMGEKEQDEDTIARVLEQTGGLFRPDDRYQVVLLENIESDESEEARIQWMPRKIIVQEYCRSWWSEVCRPSLPETGQALIVLILAFDADVSARKVSELLAGFTANIKTRFESYPFRPVLGIGRLGQNVYELPDSYQEARTALQTSKYYRYYLDEENSLLKPYREKINGYLENFVNGSSGSDIQLRSFLHNSSQHPGQPGESYLVLMDCVTEYLTRYHIDVDRQWSDLKNEIVHAMEKGEDTQCFAGQVEAFLDTMLARITEAQNDVQLQYFEKAKSFIQDHYSDSSLSLVSVSEYCGISGGYLSRIFLRFSDEGFSEYLNRYRVDQACVMLKNTSLMISDIGLKTGFNSPQSFIRVFKKYMNMTPGQYRG